MTSDTHTWRRTNFADVPDRNPSSVRGEWRLTRYEIASEALRVSRLTYVCVGARRHLTDEVTGHPGPRT